MKKNFQFLADLQNNDIDLNKIDLDYIYHTYDLDNYADLEEINNDEKIKCFIEELNGLLEIYGCFSGSIDNDETLEDEEIEQYKSNMEELEEQYEELIKSFLRDNQPSE